jgi:hypothetical protein
MLHTIVALAWYGPRPPGLVIRHLNRDPGDNRPVNLRYGTRRENNLDRYFHRRHDEARAAGLPVGGIAWGERSSRRR